MIVYEVRPDVDRFQSLLPDGSGFWQGENLTFDCQEKADVWNPPPVYVPNPKLKRGAFFGFAPGAFAVDPKLTLEVYDLLEMSGELLALPYQDGHLEVLNVLTCRDMLDEDGSSWIYGKTTGARIKIEEYAFHANRRTEVPLFKIPQMSRGQILTIEGLKSPDDEFKPRVEKLGLTGLRFLKLWEG